MRSAQSAQNETDGLEFILKHGVEKDLLDQTAALILQHAPKIVERVSSFIPPRGLIELRVRKSTNFPSGSGLYEDDVAMRRADRLRETRYLQERELLEARNPRRVQKLWQQAKTMLEHRYGRSFRDREDFAIMGGMFDRRHELVESLNDLTKSLDLLPRYLALRDEKEPGGAELVDMHRRYSLRPAVMTAAMQLVTLSRALDIPARLYPCLEKKDPRLRAENDEFDLDTTDESFEYTSAYFRMFDERIADPVEQESLDFFAMLFRRAHDGNLPSIIPLNLLFGDRLKEAGLEERHLTSFLPDPVEKLCREQLHSQYFGKNHDEDFTKYMAWVSKTALSRWEATAVDYERLFDFHIPNVFERAFLASYLTLREARQVDRGDERLRTGRLPLILSHLLEDGYIQLDDIKPPLRKYYPSETEILTSKASSGASAKLLEQIRIHTVREEGLLENARTIEQRVSTSQSTQMALPFPSSTLSQMSPHHPSIQQIVKARNRSDLSEIFEPGQEYDLLYTGENVLFITEKHFFPNGDPILGKVHAVSRLRAGADPKDGRILHIDGKDYLVRMPRDSNVKNEVERTQRDIHTDMVPASSYTVITDMSVADFKSSFGKDFLATVLLHRPHLSTNELKEELSYLNKYIERDISSVRILLGHYRDTTMLETFTLDGRFGFKLKHTRDLHMLADILPIAHALVGYLRDNGVGIYQEVGIDEAGRATIKHKKEERAFHAKHIDEITSFLAGDGLAKALAFGVSDPRYQTYAFGPAKTVCEVCNTAYISGDIYEPGAGEQYYDGIDGTDLHALARHPMSFVNDGRNLHKAQRLVSRVRESPITPTFIEFPQITPLLREFAEKWQSYSRADGDYGNWIMATQGYIGSDEPEELEDNPQLRKDVEYDEGLHRVMATAKNEAFQVVGRLETMYRALRQKDQTPDHGDGVAAFNFWAKQAKILQIYRISHPVFMLTAANQI